MYTKFNIHATKPENEGANNKSPLYDLTFQLLVTHYRQKQ